MKLIFFLIILLNFNYIDAQKADFDLKAKLSILKMQTVELHNEIRFKNINVLYINDSNQLLKNILKEILFLTLYKSENCCTLA